MREWQRPVAAAAEAPFRLCFRLEEPAAERPEWRVQYFLQAARDPSLLVPAAKVWKARGRNRVLQRPGFDARQHLLFSLGQASGIDPRDRGEPEMRPRPPATRSIATARTSSSAEKSAALEQAGFGVLLPAWWTRRGTKLRLARARQRESGDRRRQRPVARRHRQVRLAGRPGRRAAELGGTGGAGGAEAPLVKVRGQWVQMSAEEIRAALEFWSKRSDTATVREVVPHGAGRRWRPRAGFGSRASRPRAGSASLLEQLESGAQFEELPPPEGLRATLRPYQVRGYSWLAFLRRWGLGACLADDMGLGKTVQTLGLIQRERRLDGKRARAAGLPHVGGGQLAEGGGALHPRPAGDGPPRRHARQGRGVQRRRR